MSVEFDSPANRVIAAQQPKNQFRIDTSLPDLAFLRQLSVQGRLRYNFGSSSSGAAADLVTITPDIGSTVFVYRVTYLSNSSLSQVFTFRNAGNLREQVDLFLNGQNSWISDGWIDSLVGNGVDSIIIRATSANAGARSCNVWSWTENTSRIRDVTA